MIRYSASLILQGNAKSKAQVISPHTCLNDYYQKDKEIIHWWKFGENRALNVGVEMCIWVTPMENHWGDFLMNFKRVLLCDPLTLGIYSKEIQSLSHKVRSVLQCSLQHYSQQSVYKKNLSICQQVNRLNNMM